MIKTTVWSVMLYGFETWTIKAISVQKIKHFIFGYRKNEKYRMARSRTNEEVLRLFKEERTIW